MLDGAGVAILDNELRTMLGKAEWQNRRSVGPWRLWSFHKSLDYVHRREKGTSVLFNLWLFWISCCLILTRSQKWNWLFLFSLTGCEIFCEITHWSQGMLEGGQLCISQTEFSGMGNWDSISMAEKCLLQISHRDTVLPGFVCTFWIFLV